MVRNALPVLITTLLVSSAARADDGQPVVEKRDQETVETDPGRGQRRAGMIVAGAGLALWAGVAAYGFVERANYMEPGATPREQNDARARLRYIGTTSFVFALGAVSTGVILYLAAPGKTKVSSGTEIAPVIGDGRLGLAVSGSF